MQAGLRALRQGVNHRCNKTPPCLWIESKTVNTVDVVLVDCFLIGDECCQSVIPDAFELLDSVGSLDVIPRHFAEIPSASQPDSRSLATFTGTSDVAPSMSIPHRICTTILRSLTITAPHCGLIKIDKLHHGATTLDLFQLVAALVGRRPTGAPVDMAQFLGTVTTTFGSPPAVREGIVDRRRPGQPLVEPIAESAETDLGDQSEIHQTLPRALLKAETEQQRDGHQRADDPPDHAVREGDTDSKHQLPRQLANDVATHSRLLIRSYLDQGRAGIPQVLAGNNTVTIENMDLIFSSGSHQEP
mmetsp:Transcript_67091/g.178962  ORF Transcript_67091/g.178962 Transcript_67091/m.178962 type:complete len:302 (+) Transcript_67091:540-1445(+)